MNQVPMFTARKLAKAREWFQERAAVLKITTEVNGLGPNDLNRAQWQIVNGLPVGGHFEIVIARITAPVGREVRSWTQPGIRERKGLGHVVTLTCLKDKILYALLRAKGVAMARGIEVDGENTRVILAPTCQFSAGTLDMTRKAEVPIANPIPFQSLVETSKISWLLVNVDGARFYEKIDGVANIIVPREEAEAEVTIQGENARDFAWFSYRTIHAMAEEGLVDSYVLASLTRI